ncbi:lysophospholipid acyltransferase family protein [Nocardioides taihuensis]|uniref:Lysophospholipid acyltransferase family protein n=1 Tax=Nocardioides taihuensis TaxID=1835606 RepID=A0ABW0BJA7_9ACTN
MAGTGAREGWYRSTVLLGRGLLRGLGVRVRLSGTEHLPADGPALLAANHVSFLDFVFLAHAGIDRGRHVRFLCRHDIWGAPLVGRAMDGMRHVPVDRAAPAHSYLVARRLLRAGEAVGVFPEAGVSHSFTVRGLMPGAAALARDTGVPVLPVALWGGQRIWRAGRAPDGRRIRPELARGRVVDVRIGAPLPVAPDADPVVTTRRIGEVLTGLLEDVQRLPDHRPRPGEGAPWYPAHLGGDAPDRRAALALDVLPRSAVAPTWGPSLPPRPALPEAG